MRHRPAITLPIASAAILWLAVCLADASSPEFGEARILLCGEPAAPRGPPACGFALVARGTGPQVAFMDRPLTFVVCARAGERAGVSLALRGVEGPFAIRAEASVAGGGAGAEAEVRLSLGGEVSSRRVIAGGASGAARIEARSAGRGREISVGFETTARSREVAVRWRGIRLILGDRKYDVPVLPQPGESPGGPPAVMPALRAPVEAALVEWDWRLQDGIDTERAASTYRESAERALARGEALLSDLRGLGAPLGDEARRWRRLKRERRALAAAEDTDERSWESLWRRVHVERRRIALTNPLFRGRPLLFVKQVPGCFSHQLTQYYGRYARPGGGIFALDLPGESMRCRQLAPGRLPEGSYQHPELSYDGDRLLFSYLAVGSAPENTVEGHRGRYYHLYDMAADGSDVRQLTDGPFDDFSPRYLPDGRIVFVSTRRLGWHRCGYPGCENYTLALAEADGSHPRSISYHETHEWDPAVLDDGRIIYTRWDYVDRHAVYYEQLWSVRPDGSAPVAVYGNNTFNPVGIWEARQVPGSRRIMATAAAHHAMTAGSIILVDPAKGVDGSVPLRRLTPDAPFPESEAVLRPRWRAPVRVDPPRLPPEVVRWPGHCYRSPYPLSETYFLAAYSFDPLVGEPHANRANMFGVYLVDAFGTKELLYRDVGISSLWPLLVEPRRRPPSLVSTCDPGAGGEGIFFLEDVYSSQPALPRGSVKRLRILQVLPKSTPGINRPPVGLPNASPGKQVLGTVPVEADGSAYFRAPAGVPLAFQALDELGQAVQVMRSVTYLQPGETASCIGCHERRTSAPPQQGFARALARPPSTIEPGPSGSKPLSYPLLVQPVLDRKCVSCHGDEEPAGGVVLTGAPQGRYTVSYNALAPLVRYSAWTGSADFREANSEPLSTPGYFGARGSPLMRALLEGHEDVLLGRADIERLATWMDANALFYGTFDPGDQARQQRGEMIDGPALE